MDGQRKWTIFVSMVQDFANLLKSLLFLRRVKISFFPPSFFLPTLFLAIKKKWTLFKLIIDEIVAFPTCRFTLRLVFAHDSPVLCVMETWDDWINCTKTDAFALFRCVVAGQVLSCFSAREQSLALLDITSVLGSTPVQFSFPSLSSVESAGNAWTRVLREYLTISWICFHYSS